MIKLIKVLLFAFACLVLYSANAQNNTWLLDIGEIRGFGGKCLTLDGAWSITMRHCENQKKQKWRFYNDGRITSQQNNQCLQVKTGNRNGQDLRTAACVNTNRRQVWNFNIWRRIGSIPNASNNKCMDVEGPSLNTGTRTQHWDCKGIDNQIFNIVSDNTTDFGKKWRNLTSTFDSVNFANPDKNMCFSSSSCNRRNLLLGIRSELVKRYGTRVGTSSYTYWLTYPDIGEILQELDTAPNGHVLSMHEKIYIWNSIAASWLTHDLTSWQDRAFDKINIWELNHHWAIEDSWVSGQTDLHATLKFGDDYHGGLVDKSTLSAAWEAIEAKEDSDDSWLTPWNYGDASASLRHVIAFRAFEKRNDFSTFVSYWNALMRKNGQNWCRGRIYENGCGILNIRTNGHRNIISPNEADWPR